MIVAWTVALLTIPVLWVQGLCVVLIAAMAWMLRRPVLWGRGYRPVLWGRGPAPGPAPPAVPTERSAWVDLDVGVDRVSLN
jgi:hypothetical protein